MDTLSKVIFEHKLDNPINAEEFEITDYIDYEHRQECCESCYLDFEHIDMYREQINELEKITKIKVVWIKDEGIVVYLYWDECFTKPERVWVSIAARNEQNWYYNDEVIVVIDIEWRTHKEDLQDGNFVVNSIY